MIEWLTIILPYLLPTGALSAVVAWMFKRDTLRAVAEKEKDDAHKQMYDNLKQSVDDLQTDLQKHRGKIRRLEDLLFRAPSCRYYGACPLRGGLRDYRHELEGADHQGESYGYRPSGQHRPRDSDDESRGDTLGYGVDSPVDLEPP